MVNIRPISIAEFNKQGISPCLADAGTFLGCYGDKVRNGDDGSRGGRLRQNSSPSMTVQKIVPDGQ